MLTTTEIDALVERIVGRMHPQKIILFGSYAKGTATLRSDLDIFIIKETELPVAKRADALKPLLANTLIPVDVHVFTPEEVEEYRSERYSFIHSVLTTGKVVYEQ